MDLCLTALVMEISLCNEESMSMAMVQDWLRVLSIECMKERHSMKLLLLNLSNQDIYAMILLLYSICQVISDPNECHNKEP